MHLGWEPLERRELLAVVSVDAGHAVRPVATQLLGVNLAWWDSNLNTSQTKQMVQAAGLTLFRFPGGSSSDDFHFNDPPSYQGKGTDASMARFIAAVGGLDHLLRLGRVEVRVPPVDIHAKQLGVDRAHHLAGVDAHNCEEFSTFERLPTQERGATRRPFFPTVRIDHGCPRHWAVHDVQSRARIGWSWSRGSPEGAGSDRIRLEQGAPFADFP